MNDWTWLAAKIVVVMGIIFTVGPGLILAERRVSAFIQGRLGPNRVGPFGTLQPVADIIKLIMKEVIVPRAPTGCCSCSARCWCSSRPARVGGHPVREPDRRAALQIANLNIGILFLMSVLSVGVYGIALGGMGVEQQVQPARIPSRAPHSSSATSSRSGSRSCRS
jgi:NADH-quinone oxidoreductase subunit H